MPTRTFRVGIVGCGSIARVHAAVLGKMEQVRLTACADILPERAQSLAADCGAKAYASLEAMLSAEKLDAVHICTPHHLHVPMVQACVAQGLAVLMEKPPAISQAQWQQLLSLPPSAKVGVCFQNRYNANFLDARQLIGAPEIGRVIGARAFVTWSRGAGYYRGSGWRGAWETEGGGALINQSIHTLDQMLCVLGKPDSVACHMNQRHLAGLIEVEDTVEARLTFGDASALFYASTGYAADAPVLLEFQCEKAVLRLEENELHLRFLDGRRERRVYPQPETLGKGYWGNGHVSCIGDFYRCLADGETFRNDLASVENTVQVMLEMYRQNADLREK